MRRVVRSWSFRQLASQGYHHSFPSCCQCNHHNESRILSAGATSILPPAGATSILPPCCYGSLSATKTGMG
jgi:hypothetical protein